MFGEAVRRLLNFLLGSQERQRIVLGIYGPVNSGKTTLANRMTRDFTGRDLGSVSKVPHETRTIQIARGVRARLQGDGGKAIVMDIIDTPGIATHISYRTFLRFGFTKDEAVRRAEEAARGVVEAIKSLDNVDVALIVLDSAKDPLSQVNLLLLSHVEAKGIPHILVANKIDLPYARPWKVAESYPDKISVPISALRGTHVDMLYGKIYELVSRGGGS